jgi:hypothetical protein
MPIVPVQLGLRSNRGRFGVDGAARLINCFAEELGEEGKIPYPIYASAGWANFATLAGGGVRAVLELNGELYAVAGRVLNRVDSGGGVTQIGGVASDGLVTMARNRRSVPQIAITCDGVNQIVSGGILALISDPDLQAANSVTHLDGYFVWGLSDGRMFSSQIDDGTSIDGLDFATAEANPDGLRRVFARGRDLIAAGQRSIEFWANTGGETFPFTRTTSIDVGCLSPGSVCSVLIKRGSVSDAVGLIGTNADGNYAGVFLLQGYSPQKISTPQVDRDILADPNPEAISATSWDDGTHSFYKISGTSFSHVYDAPTGLWHERKSYGLDRWRASTVTGLGTRLIVGDYASPKLYVMSADYVAEDTSPIALEVHTPPVHAYPHKMLTNAVYLDVIPGVGLNSSGDELDPTVGISYSEDGGATWSAERMVAIGRQGERRKRVKSNRWGISGEDGRTWRIRMSANVAKGLTGMAADVEKLEA